MIRIMIRQSNIILMIAALTLFVAILRMQDVCATEITWPQTQLFVDYPWLAPAPGGLIQELDLTKGNPKTTLGAVGVGNGAVFGLMGLDMPQNAISNMIGPVYETGEQFFGPVWHELVRVNEKGEPVEKVEFTRSRIYRVPKTDIVVVQETNDLFLLTTITFPYPYQHESYRINRIVAFTNDSDIPTDSMRLRITAKQNNADYENSKFEFNLENRSMFIFNYNETRISILVNSLNSFTKTLSQNEFLFPYAIHFWDTNNMDPIDYPQNHPAMVLSINDLNGAHQSSQQVFDSFLSITSDAPRIDSFFDNTLSLLQTQTVPSNGAIAVMARYSGAWCRDAYGPIRFYLKAGKFEEAKRIASFYDYASRLLGFRNRYPVDLDLRKAPKEFDWSTVAPQQGDDPNILIMHVFNVWRVTHDADFVREHYGFMKRNLLGQTIDDWRLPFHGDETYQVYVMLQEGAPMKDFYSVDTSFWYVVAAEGLADMADAIGETADAAEFRTRAQQCRDFAESNYWDDGSGYYIPYVKKSDLSPATSPFADINLHALWTGYSSAADPRQRENVIATAKKLMKKNGLMKTTARVSYYTGMLPGYLLWNLKAIGLTDRADKAFDGLFKVAMSPLGEFAEAYGDNDRWLDYTHMPNVYRPWETAINADAVLYYLTGYDYDDRAEKLTLQPHLPPDANDMTISNLYAGPHKVAVSMKRTTPGQGRMDVSVTNTGDTPVAIELILEPLEGKDAPEGFESFEYANYLRRMWRTTAVLAPDESLSGISGQGTE